MRGFNCSVTTWLLVGNKTPSSFLHSSDGGNSVKRLKLDTDHDEKSPGRCRVLQQGAGRLSPGECSG